MDVDEVKEKVIEYLEKNGMSHVSELQRAIGCGRGTIYRAIRELEEEGKVVTKKKRDKRYVELRGCIPSYLKILIVATVIVAIITVYDLNFNGMGMVINLSSHDEVTVVHEVNVSPVFASFLVGFWVATIAFRFEDLVNVYSLAKARLRRFGERMVFHRRTKQKTA